MTEHRSHLAEVRAVTATDGVHSITLHCIKPGVVDDYGSLWMPDAFDESLRNRLPVLAWSHDWSDPLGRGVDFRTSSDGPEVIFEFDDFDSVPQSKRAYAQAKSGTIQDCSVGFSDAMRRDPTDDEKVAFPGIREVIERATLDEVSLVLRGAVPGAKVLSVRSAGASEPDLPWSTLDKIVAWVKSGEMGFEDGKIALALLAEETVAVPPTQEPQPDGEPPLAPETDQPPAGEPPVSPPSDELDPALDAELAEALELVERSK